MDIQQLSYFLVVAKEKHITNAAKILYVSQPALSLSISRLEKEVGMPLFVRSARSISPNDAGKVFLEFAQNTVDQYQQMLDRLSELGEDRLNTIRFGCSSQRSLSDNLGDFPEENPHLKIVYYNHSPEILAQMLLDNTLDLCVTSPPINAEGIHTDIISEEEILIATSKKSKYANRKSINLSELKDEPFIALNNDYAFTSLCAGFCRQAGFIPNYVIEVNFATLREIHRSGSLESNIAFAPKAFCNVKFSSEKNRVFLHVDDVVCKRSFGLSWREGRVISDVFSSVMKRVIETYTSF